MRKKYKVKISMILDVETENYTSINDIILDNPPYRNCVGFDATIGLYSIRSSNEVEVLNIDEIDRGGR